LKLSEKESLILDANEMSTAVAIFLLVGSAFLFMVSGSLYNEKDIYSGGNSFLMASIIMALGILILITL